MDIPDGQDPSAGGITTARRPKTSLCRGTTALGVVYGDIGTSPLYGLKQAVHAGGAPAPETIMGIVSLIFWSLLRDRLRSNTPS